MVQALYGRFRVWNYSASCIGGRWVPWLLFSWCIAPKKCMRYGLQRGSRDLRRSKKVVSSAPRFPVNRYVALPDMAGSLVSMGNSPVLSQGGEP